MDRIRAALPPPGRLARIALGLGLILVAGVFLHDRFFVAGARQAVMSGAVLTLRAPIEGALRLASTAEAGQVLPAGTVIGEVRNPRVDDARLAELARQRRLAEVELAALGRRQADALGELEAARRRSGSFIAARSEVLAARLREAASAEAAAQARAREAAAVVRRAVSLAASGVQSPAALDAARRNGAVAQAELLAAASRRRGAAAEEAAARAGTIASDPSNDRSVSQQAEDRLRLLLAELAAQREEIAARGAAIRDQEEAEAARLARLREAQLAVPVQARLLRRLAQDGEQLRAGQEVAQLADCGQLEAVAAVEARVFRSLAPGQTTWFRVAGGVWREGRIATLAAEPPAADGTGGRFQVVVRFAPAPDDAVECAAGRLGRLVF
ncbi:HlyD family efflux transporter periplasmic adaptor subunit [Falsiroseomonas sp. HC035]|uniref:HlyD family efflux transporter periplasmic adaptor subunit n=1 Tax=Falsiroseomonas sp. HC035 TaxID=3390999 RepID=UPI003D310536